MKILIVAVVLILITFTTARIINSQHEDRELKLLHVVMRHGVRAPVSTYPKDPYINQTYEPNGLGQLTNDGIEKLYEFGKFLRTRYGRFLGDAYKSDFYYAQATGVDRSIASLMTVNSGLWRPNKQQTWNENLRWFPIPVLSEPLDDDMLLLVRKDCPQYNIELKRIENTTEYHHELKKYKDLFEYIQNATGQNIKNFYDVEDVYGTLMAQKDYGLSLPSWTKGYFPRKMDKPASYSFVIKAYNDKLQRLKGGVLLKKLLKDWLSKATGTLTPTTRKAVAYGGHDSTISNLLSALKIFDPQVPNYGMAILFELRYDYINAEYGMEIFVKNSTSHNDLHPMKIPGCEHFCSLKMLVNLTKNVIPINWEEECATNDKDYEKPEQGGP